MTTTLSHRLGSSLLALLAGITACGPREYEPRAPLGVHREAIRTLGCLDVGIGVGSNSEISPSNLLLALRIGNRCQHAEAFDASALRMVAESVGGDRVSLELIDPRREIGPRHLDASLLAAENIEIAGELPADQLVTICFDLRAVAPDAESARPEPLCLHRGAEGWSP